MTDDELAMAYADGELDALAAKRFERRMADAPQLAAGVEAHRALRARLHAGFAPIAEAPLPERLTGLLHSNVVNLRPMPRLTGYWRAATAMAACLVAGIAIGHFGQSPAGITGEHQLASGSLARSLDRDLAGAQGSTRVLVSFRNRQNNYCRVFETAAIGGIACREGDGWTLRQTQANGAEETGEYRQAGSSDPGLLAAAQGMMAGDPLDADSEREAVARGWRK